MQTGNDLTAVMIPIKNTAPGEPWVCVPSPGTWAGGDDDWEMLHDCRGQA